MDLQDRREACKDARSRPIACAWLFFPLGILLILTDNTWNAYACDINETVVLENAKFINDSGLLQAGYDYFCIDGICSSCFLSLILDCWMANKRSKSGDLLPDTHRFPSGIKSLVDTIHSMGLKFGIYESAGYITCQHLPGSLGSSPKDHYLH